MSQLQEQITRLKNSKYLSSSRLALALLKFNRIQKQEKIIEKYVKAILDADSKHDKSRPSLRNSKMPINSNKDE